ncbi:hypothetical protein BDV97DRAFT_372846 [Delphinella strobiligena]|nr:hypothetical protein BDV97DRAFT_372846 [Delphinella strobiligena]
MADVQPVVFKKRGKTTNIKKRAATPPSDSGSEYSSEDESGARIKRSRKGGITTTSSLQRRADLSKFTSFAGDRSSAVTQTNDATKESHWIHADSADPSKHSVNPSTNDELPSGTYKGASNYTNFIQPSNPERKAAGPVRAATNIRTITVTDFAPDVCKDYKQTGFCGFGDSCKFLHAREDYKQGWQLDKEWESVTKGKKLQGTVMSNANRTAGAELDVDAEAEEEAKLENIPFACIICKEPYKQPIVTKCGHYFCEACALKRHKTKGGKTCAACGADTGGTFNVAKNLRKLLEKKTERIRARKEKAREAGEEVSSDEEE